LGVPGVGTAQVEDNLIMGGDGVFYLLFVAFGIGSRLLLKGAGNVSYDYCAMSKTCLAKVLRDDLKRWDWRQTCPGDNDHNRDEAGLQNGDVILEYYVYPDKIEVLSLLNENLCHCLPIVYLSFDVFS
jgi:hypothetical protein